MRRAAGSRASVACEEKVPGDLAYIPVGMVVTRL